VDLAAGTSNPSLITQLPQLLRSNAPRPQPRRSPMTSATQSLPQLPMFRRHFASMTKVSLRVPRSRIPLSQPRLCSMTPLTCFPHSFQGPTGMLLHRPRTHYWFHPESMHRLGDLQDACHYPLDWHRHRSVSPCRAQYPGPSGMP